MPDNPSSELCPLPSPRSGRLDKPVRITEQVWQEGTVPVVSVFCITYNHARFIRDAIEGFLMQETTFPVEIFIHDDASRDGTADIIREYETKYPQLFRTVLQTENQWSKHREFPFRLLAPLICGEFIAFCEGDDYWTSPHKLEKQENWLSSHPDFVIYCHEVYSNLSGRSQTLYKRTEAYNITLADLLKENPIGTLSVMIRVSQLKPLPQDFEGLSLGDWPLWLFAAMNGAIYYDPEPMGFYRVHAAGMWSKARKEQHYLISLDCLCRMARFVPQAMRTDSLKGIVKFYSKVLTAALLPSCTNLILQADTCLARSGFREKEVSASIGEYLFQTFCIADIGQTKSDFPWRKLVLKEIIQFIAPSLGSEKQAKRYLADQLLLRAWTLKSSNLGLVVRLFKQALNCGVACTTMAVIRKVWMVMCRRRTIENSLENSIS